MPLHSTIKSSFSMGPPAPLKPELTLRGRVMEPKSEGLDSARSAADFGGFVFGLVERVALGHFGGGVSGARSGPAKNGFLRDPTCSLRLSEGPLTLRSMVISRAAW